MLFQCKVGSWDVDNGPIVWQATPVPSSPASAHDRVRCRQFRLVATGYFVDFLREVFNRDVPSEESQLIQPNPRIPSDDAQQKDIPCGRQKKEYFLGGLWDFWHIYSVFSWIFCRAGGRTLQAKSDHTESEFFAFEINFKHDLPHDIESSKRRIQLKSLPIYCWFNKEFNH